MNIRLFQSSRGRTVLALVATGACAVAVLVNAPVLGADPEEEAIRAVVAQYFHGIIAYDEAALREAFHPEAQVLGTGRDGGADWQRFDDWVVYTRGAAPDPTGRENRIVSIERTGRAAVVKAELDWPRMLYTDYLSLLQIDGTWQIVNKIWHREDPRPAGE